MASRFPRKRLSRKEIEEVANFSSDDESVDLHSNILGSLSDSDFAMKSVTFSTSEDSDSDKEISNISEEEKHKRKKKLV